VWYAGWLTVLFVVFGFFVYGSLRYNLRESLRQSLERRANTIADLAQKLPTDRTNLAAEIQRRFAPEANHRFTRVVIDGTVVYTSGEPSDRSFDPSGVPRQPIPPEGESFDRLFLPDGESLLAVTVSRTDGVRTIVTEEGSAEAPLRATLDAWLIALVVGLILLIWGAAFGGYLLVQRALLPVDQIIRSAERISSRNLGERLPVPDTRVELERLSTALNHMIRRLDDAFQHTQRFLADASHELRTPLTIVRAELEAIIDRTNESLEVRGLAASALDEVDRLRKIVEDLFALSRLDSGEALTQFTLLDLGELVASTADQMCLLAEDKGISISCRSPGAVIVEGDRARLTQVIVNLLDNAIKYTPNGGHIEVRVNTSDHKAILEVADNGIGIPPEVVPRIFDRFFRADRARSRELGGAGLGLSIVKSICVAHRGAVEVKSADGKGTQITVELPLSSNGSK
jgi:heavy metal sensor kinase